MIPHLLFTRNKINNIENNKLKSIIEEINNIENNITDKINNIENNKLNSIKKKNKWYRK